MQSAIKFFPKSQVRVEVVIQEDEIKGQFDENLSQATKTVKVSGFRPGQAPKHLVLPLLNLSRVREEALAQLISRAYQQAVLEYKLYPLTEPKVKKVDFDKKKPLEEQKEIAVIFDLTVRPQVKLTDWKKIKIKKERVNVSVEEAEKALKETFKAWKNQKEKGASESKQIVTAATLAEAEQKAKVSKKSERARLAKFEKNAPDDEWAVLMGAKNLDTLRVQLQQNIQNLRQLEAGQNWLREVLKQIIKESRVDLPQILIDDEVEHKLAHLRKQAQKIGMTLEDYFKTQKKSLSEVKGEYAQRAIYDLQLEFVLDAMAKEEKIEVSDEEAKKAWQQQRKESDKLLASERELGFIKYQLRKQKTLELIRKRLLKVI